MSSSASTPPQATRAPAVPAVAAVHDPAPDPEHMVDDLDRSYGKAIVVGSIAGIVVFMAIAWVALQALAPDCSGGANAVIALWLGIWAGLFLGGTIAVGRWSLRRGH